MRGLQDARHTASRGCGVIVALAAVILSARVTTAGNVDALLRAVPDRVVAVYMSVPTAEVASDVGGQSLVAAGWIAGLAAQAGLLADLDSITRFWIDAISTLSLLRRYPYAIALLDIRAKPHRGEGHHLVSLQAAAVLRTNGDNAAIAARIQELLRLHTNTETTLLKKSTIDGVDRFTVQDNRLEEWVEIGWAFPGDYCVITVGRGALERVCGVLDGSRKSLGQNSWLQTVTDADAVVSARHALYFDFARIRGTGDAILQRKVDNVQTSLRLSDALAALLTVNYDGRSVEINTLVHADGGNRVRTIAGKRYLGRLKPSTIPDEATGFTIVDCNPSALVDALSAAYLAGRSPSGRHSCVEFWRDLQTRAGVSITRDIFARLGNTVVLHDYPMHALRIPLLWTVYIPIKDDAAALRQDLHRLLSVVREELDDGSLVRLGENDGVWFLHFGIQGPAVTVTDEALLISFSPQALRANLERLNPAADTKKPGP